MEVRVVNVVATASLGQELDFHTLGTFKEILWDSEVYGGHVAYFKTSDMEGKVSLFPTGKMISVGTKSEKRAFAELECAMTFLAERGLIKSVSLEPRIQNMVLVASFGSPINLEELYRRERKLIYEPEQFAGAILKIEQPVKATALLFASGKCVIAGLKTSRNIDKTLKVVKGIIDFKDTD